MASLMIGYDLNRPGKNYPELIEAIKAIGSWWHCLDSTWIVKTEQTAAQIRDRLRPHIDTNDELLVAKLTGEGAWAGFDNQCATWLTNNL